MTATEQALSFDCEGTPLLGILSRPPQPGPCAVVIIVGGPQYRAGSHRQFVQLARHLAQRGLSVLRFDLRGMGDSPGAQRDFEHVERDVGAAIDALAAAEPAVERIALWGLCDGASAALLYLARQPDPRVRALCLANPWVRSEQSQARTQVRHYYLDRLRQPAFWRKLLSGRVALGALRGLWRSLRAARAGASRAADPAPDFRARMAHAWQHFRGPILLLMSGKDYTAREFDDALRAEPAWQGALAREGVTRRDFEAADHTFSDDAARAAYEDCTATWLLAELGAARP